MKSVFLALLFFIQGLEAYRVICVYTNWAQYRPDGGKFMPEDVDAGLCTHLIYVYAKLKSNRLVAAEWNDESLAWSEGMYARVNNLKQINPELKTLLGVGGWMMGSKEFSKLAAGRTSRKMFATSTVKYLRDKIFDGLAIDWQHPTKRGGKPQDKVNYSLLLKEIRMAFEEESKSSGMPTLLLVTGVSASREIIDDAYEIDNMTKYTDFLNVMAYDLHGSWDNYTGHPSQLYPRDNEFGPSTEVNVDAAMRYWMSHVPDRSKLVLGISTYGRTFTLRKARHNDYNSPTTGPGVAGEFTQQPGMLAYYERCSQYADATRVWDETSQVAYWYSGDQWIAAEDIDSIKAKVNWMRYNQVGGIMISPLDMDDFSGTFCTGDVYPLLNAIHRQLVAPLPSKPREVKRKPPATKAYITTTAVLIPTFSSSTTTFATSTNGNYDTEIIPISPPSRSTSSRETIITPIKTTGIKQKTVNTGANDFKKIKESYPDTMLGTISSVRDTKSHGKSGKGRVHPPDISTSDVRGQVSSKSLPTLTTLDSILENIEPTSQSKTSMKVPEFVSKLSSPGSTRSSPSADYAKDVTQISEKDTGKVSITLDSILQSKETEGQTETSIRVQEPVSDPSTLRFDQSSSLASNATKMSENVTERASFVSEKARQETTSLYETKHKMQEIVSQPTMFSSSTEFTDDSLSDLQSALSAILSNEPAKDTAQTSPLQLTTITTLPPTTVEMKSTTLASSTFTFTTTSAISTFNIPKIPFPNFPPKGKLSKPEPVNDIELQELMRKASDLPSHSLFEGIMKLLGKSNFPEAFERTTASTVPQVFDSKKIITATELPQQRFVEPNKFIPRFEIPQSQFRRPFIIAPLKKN